MNNYFYINTSVNDYNYNDFKKYGANDSNTYIDSSFTRLQDMNLTKLKTLLTSNTTLFIGSLSHLGKTKREIKNQIEWLIDNDVPFVILNISKDTDMNEVRELNKKILNEIKEAAQIETDNVKSAQRIGIEAARTQGKQLGRSKIAYPSNWEELYLMWENKEITAVEFMNRSRLKKGTFYNLLKHYNLEKKKENSYELKKELVN